MEETNLAANGLLGTGNWTYSSVVANAYGDNSSGLCIDVDSTIPSTITLMQGLIYPYGDTVGSDMFLNNATLTTDVPLGNEATYDCDYNITFAKKVTIGARAYLGVVDTFAATCNGGIDLAGTVMLGGDAVLDSASPVNVTATGAEIDWYGGTIYGGLNANGFTVTHTDTIGATLIVDQPGILDLGTTNNTVAGLTVNISATTHLNKNWTMAGMTVALGSSTLIADADLTIDGSATSITATAAVIHANGHTVSVKNLGDKAVTCYGCTDDGGNTGVVFEDYNTTNWTAATNTDFTNSGNWSNGVPLTGDTIQFLDSTVALPTTNLPNAGEVFALVIRDDVGAGWEPSTTYSVTDFVGALNCALSSIVIGGSGQINDELYIDKDLSVGGTLTAWGFCDVATALPNAIITVKGGGFVYFEGYTIGHLVTVESGGLCEVGGNPTILAGGLSIAGSLQLVGNTVLNAAISLTGDLDCDWDVQTVGNDVINGAWNAAGFTVTHTHTAGATLIVDQPGVLDLGTTNNTVDGLTVQLATTAHLTKNWSMAGMTVGLGTGTLIADADLTIDGASATNITATAAVIHANGHAVTVKNLGDIIGDNVVTCYGCTDGGSNGTSVVFISTDATISAGTLASQTISGTFTGGASTVASSALTVTVSDANKTNAALALTQGNANSIIKYVNGSQPANDAAYTGTYSAGSTTITVANNDIIWLLVTAQDTTTKLYYKITVTVSSPLPTNISTAGVTGFVAPATGGTPQAFGALGAGDASYTVTGLTWSPTDNPFHTATVYTATVVLTSAATYKFPTGGIAVPTANGDGTVSVGTTSGGDISGNYLTFTVLFSATAAAPSGGGYYIPPRPSPLTPAETTAKIAEIKQQLIVLITQLIQMLMQQVAGMG